MSQDIAAADPGPRLRRRRLVLIAAIAVVLIVAVSLVAVSCSGSRDSGPPTVRVDRGTSRAWASPTEARSAR